MAQVRAHYFAFWLPFLPHWTRDTSATDQKTQLTARRSACATDYGGAQLRYAPMAEGAPDSCFVSTAHLTKAFLAMTRFCLKPYSSIPLATSVPGVHSSMASPALPKRATRPCPRL